MSAPSDPPAETLPPEVRAALERLNAELETLRAENAVLKRRASEAEALADHDALAPVLNRRGFLRELKRHMAFARRYRSPLCVLYLDLDGFKTVNDVLGHAAGDAALQTVARVLKENVRESDLVGRLGGDEFAVALVEADLETARAKAESLSALIASAPFGWGGTPVRLGGSFGVRAFEAQGSAEELLAEADALMFVRKRDRSAAR